MSTKEETSETESLHFFDPHFHIWNLSKNPPIHDVNILFPSNNDPNYTLAKYEAEFQGNDDNTDAVIPCTHIGGVFMEAMSVCYPSEENINCQCLEEASWVIETIRRDNCNNKEYVVVGSVCLEADDASETLRSLAALSGEVSFVGIRQIVNKDPSWPRNGVRDDFLTNLKWQNGYSLLANHQLSFDLQCNPSQFTTAAKFISNHPNIPVIVNHMGCFLGKDLEDDSSWKGLEDLAALSHVFIKISMLCYTHKDWDTKGKGREETFNSVNRVITMFGVERCMFASNFPVDAKDGWCAKRLLSTFVELLREYGYNEKEMEMMFSKNAMRVYKVERK